MLVAGPAADVVQLHVNQAGVNSFLQQALTEVPGEDRGEQGQDVESHIQMTNDEIRMTKGPSHSSLVIRASSFGLWFLRGHLGRGGFGGGRFSSGLWLRRLGRRDVGRG